MRSMVKGDGSVCLKDDWPGPFVRKMIGLVWIHAEIDKFWLLTVRLPFTSFSQFVCLHSMSYKWSSYVRRTKCLCFLF